MFGLVGFWVGWGFAFFSRQVQGRTMDRKAPTQICSGVPHDTTRCSTFCVVAAFCTGRRRRSRVGRIGVGVVHAFMRDEKI